MVKKNFHGAGSSENKGFLRITFSPEEIKNQFYDFLKADVEIRPNPRSF